jgi:phosphoenolpyruvate carboxykinase (ATP)
MKEDLVFKLRVPQEYPTVPAEMLNPRSTWSDPQTYDAQTRRLAEMFAKNFEPFVVKVPPAIAAAEPRRK